MNSKAFHRNLLLNFSMSSPVRERYDDEALIRSHIYQEFCLWRCLGDRKTKWGDRLLLIQATLLETNIYSESCFQF